MPSCLHCALRLRCVVFVHYVEAVVVSWSTAKRDRCTTAVKRRQILDLCHSDPILSILSTEINESTPRSPRIRCSRDLSLCTALLSSQAVFYCVRTTLVSCSQCAKYSASKFLQTRCLRTAKHRSDAAPRGWCQGVVALLHWIVALYSAKRKQWA